MNLYTEVPTQISISTICLEIILILIIAVMIR